jgi:alpha/beta superfamily hydrolase
MAAMSWKDQAITIPVPGEDLALEAVWQTAGDRAAVVAPPHPEYGGSLDNPVVTEMAHGLYRCGVASIRFNWRGVGGSGGGVTGAQAAADADFAAALEQLAGDVEEPLIAAGYSFGAAAALRAALRDHRVQSLLLVAPPAGMIESLPIAEFEHPLYVFVGQHDPFAPPQEVAALIGTAPRGRVEVIPDADHFFATGGLGQLSRLIPEIFE